MTDQKTDDLQTDDLQTELARLLSPFGLDLTEQTTTYRADAGILRWEARHGTKHVIVEHWTKREDPDERWYLRVGNAGVRVEVLHGLTLDQAVDVCALVGLLPRWQAPLFRAGAAEAADAIESHAPERYDGRAWVAAAKHARDVAR
jgi:hypothetical protein